MLLYELADEDLLTGYYDPASDTLNMRKPSDTRKSILTLKHLNRLKKMRAVQKLENLKHQDLISIIYAQPEEPAGGAAPPF